MFRFPAARPAVVAEPLTPGLRRAAWVVMIGASMSFLDSTIVNVALRSLSASLHASLAGVQWAVTGYLLVLAAMIPVTGWAARRVGESQLYVAALAVFTVGSALCALSASLDMLVACRVLQGAGGGAILPVGTMIWTGQATRAQMARVMSLIGAAVVLAPMLGPTVGGLLIEGLGWQAIFWLNVPVGVLGCFLALRLLPRAPGRDAGPLDLAGFVLASGGTVAVTYGLAGIGSQGGLQAAALVALAAGTLVVSHGNTLRALIKHLDRIPGQRIAALNVPTGIPLAYQLGPDMRPVTGARYLSHRPGMTANDLGYGPTGLMSL